MRQTQHPALVAALRTLQQPGLAAADIPDDSPLLSLAVTLRAAPSGADPTELRSAFRDVFSLVVESDLAGLDRDVSLRLFALDRWAGRSYGARIDDVENLTKSRWDTAFRKEPLRKLLDAIATALVETRVELVAKPAVPATVGYEVPRFAFSQRYEGGRDPRRLTLEHRHIRAIGERVDGLTVRARTRRADSHSRDPEITIYGADSIDLTDIARDQDGRYFDALYTYRVGFGQPLDVGEEVQFWITRVDDTPLRFPPDPEDVGWLGSLITLSPGEFEAQVVFPADASPTGGWWYADLAPTAEPSRDPSRRLPLRGRTLAARFPAVQLGHRYGIAWSFEVGGRPRG